MISAIAQQAGRRADADHAELLDFVDVLEEDPELAEGIEADRLPLARRRTRASVMRLARGPWAEPEWPSDVAKGPGLLVLDGMLLRRVGLERRFGGELLGHGDLLRPWQREDAIASVPRSSDWRVLEDSRIAVLDVEFASRIGGLPELQAQLVARALRRSRQLAVSMAIVQQPKVDDRVHMMLWHLADRWGTMRPEGALVPLPLTHAMLAELVAARRPTVSAALGELERASKVVPAHPGWMLHGDPPGELEAVARHG